jgi:hypothetical protein
MRIYSFFSVFVLTAYSCFLHYLGYEQMKEYIKNCHGFQEKYITILMDDGKHTSPTAKNIIAAYAKIVSESQSGDVIFCHYSGTLWSCEENIR